MQGWVRRATLASAMAVVVLICAGAVAADGNGRDRDNDYRGDRNDRDRHGRNEEPVVQLGPRPYYLVDRMSKGWLKEKLQECAEKKTTFVKHEFSIGHRGAPLQYPEHTKEAYEAGARMGAGILECDVTFTKDKELVCRHSQCDLHTTTDILLNPDNADLAAKCGTSLDPQNPAVCCTSDLTLTEFKRLKGKMDAGGATASWRTDLYATGGTLLTHRESIRLFSKLGVQMTPELKSPAVKMPFDGFSQEDYARKMIDEYKKERVSPKHVWPQSFNLADVLYWIGNERNYGRQAVFLEGRDAHIDPNDPSDDNLDPNMKDLRKLGVRIVAPPMWMLVTVEDGDIVPSRYARAAKRAGLDIISWTTERSGRIVEEVLANPASNGYYYQSTLSALENDGDILRTIDVLAKDVGIIGLFSDWAATTTFYANCMLDDQKQH